MDALLLNKSARDEIWRLLQEAVEDYMDGVSEARVAPRLDREGIRRLLQGTDFSEPVLPLDAVRLTVRGLWEHQVHTSHPCYFGLFNPAPTFMGIVADALVAAFNPQLAAWSHSPFAAEVEKHLVRAFARKLGYATEVEGTLSTGGMEANHTAVLVGLIRAFPDFAERGVRALDGQPVLYVTRESHDSFRKAARLCGLGSEAAVAVPTDSSLRMDPEALQARIVDDRSAGRTPFLVVATLGTTGAGIVDPVGDIAAVAAREELWCHADAAWGGAVALAPELREIVSGIERADSITLDAHKWLSVPMGAGMFLTRHKGVLERTFRVSQSYMPLDARHLDVQDPYAHSMQWSRRFIGLKIFLSLAVAGWEGYADAIRGMTEMGDRLRTKLTASGWEVVNRTPLPVVCFVDATHPGGRSSEYLEGVSAAVLDSGKAWISTARIGGGQPVLRACICSYRTRPEHIDVLVEVLEQARRQVKRGVDSTRS